MRGQLRILMLALVGPFAHSGLRNVFNAACPMPPQADYGVKYKAPAHYHHDRRNITPIGRAHSFSPPARPAKKKGHNRPSGRFY